MDSLSTPPDVCQAVGTLSWTDSRQFRTFLAQMNPQAVGKRLRELRENSPHGNLSREDVGRRINVSSKTVERWESGHLGKLLKDPKLIRALADCYQTDLDSILPTHTRVEIERPLRDQLNEVEQMVREIYEYLNLGATQPEKEERPPRRLHEPSRKAGRPNPRNP